MTIEQWLLKNDLLADETNIELTKAVMSIQKKDVNQLTDNELNIIMNTRDMYF